jgi:hypothetical protein
MRVDEGKCCAQLDFLPPDGALFVKDTEKLIRGKHGGRRRAWSSGQEFWRRGRLVLSPYRRILQRG